MNAVTMGKRPATNSFSMKRLFMLMRIRIREDSPAVLMAAAGILAVDLLAVAVTGHGIMGGRSGEGFAWAAAISLGGVILASRAFSQFHSGRAAVDAILLPASNAEKYTAALAACLLVYPAAASVIAFLASAVTAGAQALAGNGFGMLWHPFAAGYPRAWAEYAAVAIFFVMGSATFRKLSLLKTLLAGITAFLLPAALLLFGMIAIYKAKGQEMPMLSYINGVLSFREDFASSGTAHTLAVILDVYRYAALPILALAFGFLKMSKKEIADEVQ